MTEDDKSIPSLIRDSWAKGSPTDWFETLYAAAVRREAHIPWAQMHPNPDMVEWMKRKKLDGMGKTALVIGCGLGDDAEELAAHGFDVTAFDVSESAIAWCKERFPESRVQYLQADLLNPPTEWNGKFDFVLESRTIQSLPYTLAEQVIRQIAAFVAPGGTLLVICHARSAHEKPHGIPWGLSVDDLVFFPAMGLHEVQLDDFSKHGIRRFRVEYQRMDHD